MGPKSRKFLLLGIVKEKRKMSNKELSKKYQESLKQRREKQTKRERALEGTVIAPLTDKNNRKDKNK